MVNTDAQMCVIDASEFAMLYVCVFLGLFKLKKI